jgi:sulfatase maturation enzyme AslB (radical SAM superfamily)
MNSNFCPAPWNGIFYHIDSASVCCVNKTRIKVSPKEFRNSKHVKQLQDDFLLGHKPPSCVSCWQAEATGVQSIRQHFIKNSIAVDNNYNHMELRASNLCNFKCIMCKKEDSSEIAKEVRSINDTNWAEVLEIAKNLKTLILTGGEPMLIKRYYELLDYLDKNVRLIIFTNCSVYNPKFIEKMLSLNNVKLKLSLDGVEETAEFQRKNTVWSTVKNNAIAFSKLPMDVEVHITITKHNIIDIERLVDFILELHNFNNKLTANAHCVFYPEDLHFSRIDQSQLKNVINQINSSLIKLNGFELLQKQLTAIKHSLLKNA